MTRDQFIARLLEVWFVSLNDHVYTRFNGIKHTYTLYLVENMDLFMHMGREYTFDELEQFLIDKGIIENPFDAHKYLIERGWKEYPADPSVYYTIASGDLGLGINLGPCSCLVNGNQMARYWNFGNDKKVTKQSCDKAIALVEFLIELEQ